jgi:hypothetical protein
LWHWLVIDMFSKPATTSTLRKKYRPQKHKSYIPCASFAILKLFSPSVASSD